MITIGILQLDIFPKMRTNSYYHTGQKYSLFHCKQAKNLHCLIFALHQLHNVEYAPYHIKPLCHIALDPHHTAPNMHHTTPVIRSRSVKVSARSHKVTARSDRSTRSDGVTRSVWALARSDRSTGRSDGVTRSVSQGLSRSGRSDGVTRSRSV